MSEKRRSSNFRDDVRTLYQNWVHKLSRGIRGKKWKKRWMVVRSNGKLKSYKERPISLKEKVNHNTFEIGPESIVRWVKNAKAISLTVGEKPSAYERVFRVLSPSSESTQGKENEEYTKEWFTTLKEIALRKRMWYVLQMRSGGQEELKTSFPTVVSPPPLYEQKDVSEALEHALDEMFDKDSQDFWRSGLRWSGHNIYYEFKNSDVEILWHMYAKSKFYLCSDCLELLLDDAFGRAYNTKGTHIKKNTHNFALTINERAYAAKVFLDSNKDGFVDFEDFKLINTRAFWKNVDFLTPILPDHESKQLWLSVFQCLEDTGTLSKKIIHKLWMRYNSKDDGFLYQQDMEAFLADFMDATVSQWPIDEFLVDDFHKMISTRAAIALRFLNRDESGKVSIQQFAAISQEDFWVHVDFFPTEEEEPDDPENKSQSPPPLVSEPSVENIMKALSGADLLIEVDMISTPHNEPEDAMIVIQELEGKTHIPEETERKLECTIERLSTLRDKESFMQILDAISENSIAESDLSDSYPNSTSSDVPRDSNKAARLMGESMIFSLLTETTVTERRHSLRFVREDLVVDT